jgi:ectoine hydroxylase-related dioxygenase (phytanoyl-CoA dioxygenase family)
MHRKRVRLARRAHRAATAVEKRGVRATYRLHDRLLSNRSSRKHYHSAQPSLDAVQQGIVDDLDAKGFSVLSLRDFLDDGTADELLDAGARFISETEAGLAREAAGEESELRRRAGKEFVVRGYSYGVSVGMADPWFRAGASRRMVDLANAYLRMWSKLEYFDTWYSVPQPQDADRIASQRWHRDFNDKHLLKAFLYLVDVDEDNGPFQYVPGSSGSGPYAGEWPWSPLGENYPDEQALAERIPAADVQTFTGVAGTMVFCNTSGFHRGGFTTGRPRVLATWTYSSPASLASLTERSYIYAPAEGDPGLDELEPVVRFAVT